MANASLTIRRDWARVDLAGIPALMQASGSQISDVIAGAATLDLSLRRIKLNLPVFALGTSARAPRNHGPGTVGVSVTLSTTTIQAGDFIMVDEDGVSTIPSTNIHNIEPRLEALFTRDRLIQDRVASGATKPPNFENLLSQAGVHWIA